MLTVTKSKLSRLLFISLPGMMIAIASAGLVIKDDTGASLSLIDAGETISPDPRVIGIRIENTGAAAVEGLSAVTEGGAAADFSMIDLSSTTIPAGSFVTAKVQFEPMALGVRTAVLRISSTVPTPEETTLNLTGIGGTSFSPIVSDPSVIQYHGWGSGMTYSFRTMTLHFQPVDQVINMYRPIADQLIVEGGIVHGVYQGVLYPYLVGYTVGPPPARIPLMILRLAFGTARPEFDAKLGGSGGTVAIQGDGKLIVSGGFSTVDGQPRQGIVRLNEDGTVDGSFHCTVDGVAESIAIDPSGNILICGIFDTVNGVAMPGLARLNPDGSLDWTFSPSGASDYGVRVIALPDGKILCSGDSLQRLNEDGSPDPTFTPIPVSSVYNSFAVQRDGKIVADSNGLKRYEEDGMLDSSFSADVASVTAIAIQEDGKIVIGGHFAQVNGVARSRVARLNPDGTLDSSFAGVTFSTGDAVSCVAVEEGGGIVISGVFTKVDGLDRSSVARLKQDGTLDKAFAPVGDASRITGMTLDRDGSVYVAGAFSLIGGENRNGLAKLRNWPSVAEFEIEGDTLRWRRSGSAPALGSVMFQVSVDSGALWGDLGAPVRIGDNWVLEDVELPANGFIRATGRSRVSTRGSGLIQETYLFGRELTPIEIWRAENFGSPLNEGVGADFRDYDRDGHQNLMEYAFALDPKVQAAGVLPTWQSDGDGYRISFTKPASVSGVNYSAEWSETLEEYDWQPADNFSVGDAKSFRVEAGESEKKFFRLRISNP